MTTPRYYPEVDPNAVRNAKQDLINESLNSIANALKRECERMQSKLDALNRRLDRIERVEDVRQN